MPLASLHPHRDPVAIAGSRADALHAVRPTGELDGVTAGELADELAVDIPP